MPRIDWRNAGNVGEDQASILQGFNGGSYVDSEIHDSGNGFPAPEFDAWLKKHIEPLLQRQWRTAEVVQQPPILVNGLGSGAAEVHAFVTPDGDRLEHWKGADEENDDVNEDFAAFLQTSDENILLVAIACSHPFVACDKFLFGNSDGSTFDAPFQTNDGATTLLREMMARAKVYAYKQIH